MNISSMIEQSFIIMILGMFIVFVFLLILIFFINLFHFVLNRKNQNLQKAQNILKDNENPNNFKTENIINKEKKENIIAAIYLAIKKYEDEKIITDTTIISKN